MHLGVLARVLEGKLPNLLVLRIGENLLKVILIQIPIHDLIAEVENACCLGC